MRRRGGKRHRLAGRRSGRHRLRRKELDSTTGSGISPPIRPSPFRHLNPGIFPPIIVGPPNSSFRRNGHSITQLPPFSHISPRFQKPFRMRRLFPNSIIYSFPRRAQKGRSSFPVRYNITIPRKTVLVKISFATSQAIQRAMGTTGVTCSRGIAQSAISEVIG